jgi:thiosulfate/3-mercaptopyruvate sulfurtransferase
MVKASKCALLMVLAGCLMLTLPAKAAEGVHGNLVDVQWLAKNLHDPNVLILDAAPQSYAKQHIPGAVSANVYALFKYGVGGAPASESERLFQSWGVSPGKKIVIYDGGADNLATRLFFDLDYHGYKTQDLYVLDGGLFKWQKEGLPVTSEPTPLAASGTFRVSALNEDARVELPEFVTASGDTANSALLEGLGPDWHFGQTHPFSKAGHIPHGILAPAADFFNADKTFKSPEEIRTMLMFLGVKPEQRVYTYCGGGVAASVPFFAARFIANYPKVKLFPESEMGWISDERDLPYWTYDAPFLMRDSDFLQLWASRMLRTFMDTPVSIVDLRSPEAFNQGHVPFSVNVPADVFRTNFANPGSLAGMLGSAGVHAGDEAVVISGAGLTKDSALAFVTLERLGQKKVSILIDPMEKIERPGFALTKEATVVGPRTSPKDLVVPRTAYSASLRKDVVVADAGTAPTVYPRIYIASGANASAKAQDGKVIHVAYTELLNADGTPKAAKDIWAILSKAGVSRYAQLVCVSDDPGEAAVNYFILKLMGFPDVKMGG